MFKADARIWVRLKTFLFYNCIQFFAFFYHSILVSLQVLSRQLFIKFKIRANYLCFYS